MSSKIIVVWDDPELVGSVNITRNGTSSTDFEVGGSPATFPYLVSASTSFETTERGTYTVSIMVDGVEVANTPDASRVVTLDNNSVVIKPSADINLAAAIKASVVNDVADSATPLGTALSASYAAKGKTNRGLRTVLLGDSYMATAYSTTGTPGTAGSVLSYPARSPITWANFWLNGRLDLVGLKGASGEQTAQWLARYDTDVRPLLPDLVIMGSAGINDMGNGKTPAQVMTTLSTIFDLNESLGATTVMLGPVPQGGPATTAQKTFIHTMQALLRREALDRNGSLIVLDIHPMLSDLTDTDTWLGLPAAKYTADGTHLGLWGAMRVGKALADALASRVPPMELWPSGTASKYATTDTNLCANAGLTGTAGTLGNGATGQVADSWKVNSQSGAAFAGTVTCSKVAATDYRGDWQRIAISGAASDAQFYQDIFSGMTAGKTYIAGMEVRSTDYQPTGGAGSFRLRFGERAGGTSAYTQGVDVSGIDESLGFATDLNVGQGIALTPPIVARAGVDRLQPDFLLRGTGTVDFRRPFVMQID